MAVNDPPTAPQLGSADLPMLREILAGMQISLDEILARPDLDALVLRHQLAFAGVMQAVERLEASVGVHDHVGNA